MQLRGAEEVGWVQAQVQMQIQVSVGHGGQAHHQGVVQVWVQESYWQRGSKIPVSRLDGGGSRAPSEAPS